MTCLAMGKRSAHATTERARSIPARLGKGRLCPSGRSVRPVSVRSAVRDKLDDSVDSFHSLNLLTLHVGDSTMKFPVDNAAAHELKQATLKVFDLFKEKETWERPRRLDNVKLKLRTRTSSEILRQDDDAEGSLEVSFFVNPNAHPTVFQAKVLFGLKDNTSGIQVSTEIPLSKFKQDLDAFA